MVTGAEIGNRDIINVPLPTLLPVRDDVRNDALNIGGPLNFWPDPKHEFLMRWPVRERTVFFLLHDIALYSVCVHVHVICCDVSYRVLNFTCVSFGAALLLFCSSVGVPLFLIAIV